MVPNRLRRPFVCDLTFTSFHQALEKLYRQKWSRVFGVGAVIISPTRELAYQTFEVLRKVCTWRVSAPSRRSCSDRVDQLHACRRSSCVSHESRERLRHTPTGRCTPHTDWYCSGCNRPSQVGKQHEFSAGLIIGGKDFAVEQGHINNMNIIICTPGRLLQHMDETPDFSCSDMQILGTLYAAKSGVPLGLWCLVQ